MESIGEYTLTSDEEKDIADKAELAKDQMTTEKNQSELEAADNSDSLGANEVGPAEGQSALASNTCTTSEEKPVSTDQNDVPRKCHSERRSSVNSRHHHRHHHHRHRSKNRSPSHGKSRSSRRRSRSSSSSSGKHSRRRRSSEYGNRHHSRSGSKPRNGRYRRTFGDRVDGHRSERATVNADDLMQQVQERKRLWQSNKAEKKISSQWQQLISSCDNRQTANKFCKLMGIKGDAIIDNDPTCAEKQECDRNSRVMENLDRQYAEARILTHTCRGMGLGYGSGH